MAEHESNYRFTYDWFDHYKSVWDTIIEERKPSRIIEIGAFEGRSTVYLIEKCSAQNPIEIHSIDTWEGSLEHSGFSFDDIEKRFDYNVNMAISMSINPVKFVKHKKKIKPCACRNFCFRKGTRL